VNGPRGRLCQPSHPIIAVTGSSGAGTTSVTRTFNSIFRRERIKAVLIEGDSFHRYDRLEMKEKMAEASAAGDQHFSHFGPVNNLFEELESLFRAMAKPGEAKVAATCTTRRRRHVSPGTGHFSHPGRTFARGHRPIVL